MDKIRIGMLGAWRGNNYIDLMLRDEEIELTAVCDRHAETLNSLELPATVKKYTEFEEFLAGGKKAGMNAVFLCNYFHQHAPFAIKAMEAGMDVVSECTSAGTMKECVELVRAVERTGRKYMIAENYPFSLSNMEIARLCRAGKLGTPLYAEGEYNHSGPTEDLRRLSPGKYHWRAWLPRTYYVTHAMGPLMYMTDSMPKYVSGRSVYSPAIRAQVEGFRNVFDGVGMMFCEMDNGMIARFTGCTAMVSDYSRYRVCGDVGGAEGGTGFGENVRLFYHSFNMPEGIKEPVTVYRPDPASFGKRAEEALKAGHGGGDFWIIENMKEYFLRDVTPFFDVYKGVAMSATAILGLRSSLNHGENYPVPDFRKEEERVKWENDDLTPFPDENGEGATMPCTMPYPERIREGQ